MASESVLEPTGRARTRSGVIYSPEYRRTRQRTSQGSSGYGSSSSSKDTSLNTSYENEQNLKNTSSSYQASFTQSSSDSMGGVVILGSVTRSGSNRSTRSGGSGSRKSAASSGSGHASLQGGRAVSKESVSVVKTSTTVITTSTMTSESQSWQSSETSTVAGSSGIVNGFSSSAVESSASQAAVGDTLTSATLSTRSGSGRSSGSSRSGRSSALLVGGTVSSALTSGTSTQSLVTDTTQSESSTKEGGSTSYIQGSASHSSTASSIRGSSGRRSVVQSSSHGSSASERAVVTGVTSETALTQSATTLSSAGSGLVRGGSGRSSGLLVVGSSGSRSSQKRGSSLGSSSARELTSSENLITQTSTSSQHVSAHSLGLTGGILASTPRKAAAPSSFVTKETTVTTATVNKEEGGHSSVEHSGSYRFPIYVLRKFRSLLGWQERQEVEEVQDLDTLKEAYDTPKMMRRGLRGSSKSKFDDSIIEDSVTEGSYSYSESKTKESRSTNRARRRHSGKSDVMAGSIYGTTEKSMASEKTLSKLYESESVTQDRLSYESDGEYGDYSDSAYSTSEAAGGLTIWEMVTMPFVGLFWWMWWLVGTPVYWFVTTVMMLDAWILSRVTILKNTIMNRKGPVFVAAAFPLRLLLLPLLLLLLLLALYYLWPLSFLTGIVSSVASTPGALLAWLPWYSSTGAGPPVRGLHMTMHEKVLNDFRAEQIRSEMRTEIQRLSATVADVVRKWEQSSQAGSQIPDAVSTQTEASMSGGAGNVEKVENLLQSASAAAMAGGMDKDEIIALITAIVKEHMEGLRKDVSVQDQAILADLDKLRTERENQLAMLEIKMQTINSHSEDLTKQLVEAKQKIKVETNGGVGTSSDMLEHIHRLESELASLKMELGRVQQQSDMYHQELKKYSMNISLIEQQLSITVQQALQEDSSALVSWLKSRFVGQSDFDSKVNDIVSRVTENVSQKLKVETSVSRTSAGEVTVDEERIRAIVNKHIGIYDADKTGMVDHALESAGGSVLSLRCTETYESKSAQLSILGIPLWYKTNSPRTVIQPDVHPGNCWAFRGSEGYMVIQLSGVVKPTSFSLEHIPKSLSPTGQIDSAPKDFTVYGLEDETQAEGDLLGNYTYDDNAEPLQYFPVQVTDVKPYPIVELRILSNHGNPDYTCIYRFRVHGILQK
ncbi:PREDICTED: SUN domain-containing protein 2-like isoform X6 [Branchiostoma belcheri]|uniref:SUN domain-containing protein 2-like isoform X6 n=1 Tax=Branchiostoma belcheri TaxID=7741 RepID=A0A6P4XZ10_BRABE|nr:PREDICTED: SUN domain-containing protein 2-like isoform X6 [Branchiostoma belcheri]